MSFENFAQDEQKKSNKPSVPLNDVALGVTYYYWAIKLMILLGLFGFIGIMVYAVAASSSPESKLLEDYNTLGGLLTIITMVFVATPIYRAMSLLSRTPSQIIPNAKSKIVSSWVLWGIAFVISVFARNAFFNLDAFTVCIASSVSAVLNAFAFYTFAKIISTIGKFSLPDRKDCQGAITCLMISYALTVVSIIIMFANSNAEVLEGGQKPGASLASIAGLLYLVGGIMYLSYIEKLNRFFRTNFDIKELDAQYAKEPKVSGFFISLVAFSALVLLVIAPAFISGMSKSAKKANVVSNPIIEQAIADYAEIESKSTSDWNDKFSQYNNQKITDEQFDEWIVNTHLPAWENALNVLEKVKDDDVRCNILKDITRDRIGYCQGFHAALEQHSTDLYSKAYKDFQRTDLKVTKFVFSSETMPPEAAQQTLIKSIVAEDGEMLKWSISKGADVNKEFNGVKALPLAKELKYQNMVDILLENGAVDEVSTEEPAEPLDIDASALTGVDEAPTEEPAEPEIEMPAIE